MTKKTQNLTNDDDFEDGLFDWLASTFEPNQPSTVDLTQYEVNLGTIDKDPTTGDETLSGFEVRKK